ncbi:MAG: signal peptidase [Bacteroidota bacterium]|jgi:signal peptidase I
MQYHLIVTLPIFLLLHTGLALTFKKAGESWWKGLVPLYNVYVWLQLVKKPKWWIIFYMIPVLNFVMGIGIILDLVKSFGKQKFLDHALAVIFPYFYFIYLGLNKKDQFKGNTDEPTKSTGREWMDAILFAGVAALVIRTFLLEAFMIPTTSMEGSLLAGDFLFVSKVHYGVRMPMAPLSVPFVHNTLPLTTGTKSYLDWITLPYSRLPALKSIDRYDIVVFNYPDDDIHPDVDALGKIEVTSMKQNYIKRCVATPGDMLEIRDRQLFINGEKGWNPEFMQFSYLATGFYAKTLEKEGFRVAPPEKNGNAYPDPQGSGAWVLNMNETRYQKLKTIAGTSITPNVEDLQSMDLVRHRSQEDYWMTENPKYALFPKAPSKVLWTKDDFGPLWIPKKGASIPLNDSTLTFYEKCIKVYEDNTLEFKDGKYLLNGEVATSYTFKLDYYWMMGDNRHQSLDSRYWGFVPEDHIVGRPWFVLFSFEGGPRWDRFFKPATKWEP